MTTDWIITAARWSSEHRVEISIGVYATFALSIYWLVRRTWRSFRQGLRLGRRPR